MYMTRPYIKMKIPLIQKTHLQNTFHLIVHALIFGFDHLDELHNLVPIPQGFGIGNGIGCKRYGGYGCLEFMGHVVDEIGFDF